LLPRSEDVCYITAWDAHNHEIFTWSFLLGTPSRVLYDRMGWYNLTAGKNPAELKEQDSSYVIAVDNVILSINKYSGLLTRVQQDGKILPFNNGPVIQEGVNNFSKFTYYYDEDSTLVVSSRFDRKNNYNTLQWKIYPSGVLQLELKYFPGAFFTDFVGVNFSFPEKEMKSIQYLGDGPYRVWKNRMKGTRFGIWNKTYNNTETGEAPWIYPEFKGYYSNMYWCRFITNDQSFKVMTDNEDLFLRLFTPAFKDDPWHNYQLLFPNGDISFMQAIPGIGTKTQRPETTGPMGMKNIYYDYDKDPTRALEMVLYFDFSGK
jgi:hypothetical protein